VSLLITVQFDRYARDTLHGVPPASGWRHALRSFRRWVACLALGAALWAAASRQLTTKPANLANADLSIKPDGWVDGQSDISHVKGAKLRDAHLEYAHMMDAFLVSADLSDAHLNGADLTLADLRGARLIGADLRDANLAANLEGARLIGADLRNAVLSGANLVGADLSRAKLTKTGLIGVDLTHSWGLTEPQLREAILDSDTELPPDFQHLIPRPDFQRLIPRLDFHHLASPAQGNKKP